MYGSNDVFVCILGTVDQFKLGSKPKFLIAIDRFIVASQHKVMNEKYFSHFMLIIAKDHFFSHYKQIAKWAAVISVKFAKYLVHDMNWTLFEKQEKRHFC